MVWRVADRWQYYAGMQHDGVVVVVVVVVVVLVVVV